MSYDRSIFGDPTAVNPDCAARDRVHPPHQLASPGGAKPGAHCAGVPDADGNHVEPHSCVAPGGTLVACTERHLRAWGA